MYQHENAPALSIKDLGMTVFRASYDHTGKTDCRGCDPNEEVQRDVRDSTDPKIHYGIIASGNTSVKDATERIEVAKRVGEK